jgi:L-rhamnose mutarotase
MTCQYAFHLSLPPGRRFEYERLHQPVPSAVVDQLLRAGISDYSIFAEDDEVFGVFSYEDADVVRSVMSEDADKTWTASVLRLLRGREIDPRIGMPVGLPRIFRLDGQEGTPRPGRFT